jgi:nitroreductase
MYDIIEGIGTRHSVRQFTGEPVQEDDLDTILHAAMAAPSAVNVQPWAFICVTDRVILDTLCAELPYAKMLDKAGSAIIVCGLPGKDTQIAKDFWPLDCAAATENILLAAHALGYGAVWTAVYPDNNRITAVRAICKIPETSIPFNVIPIGVPTNPNTRPVNKYRPENIHRNVW